MSEQTESIELSVVLPASPERVYGAWLDSREHGAFTKTNAAIEPVVYGRYSVSDGYIEGITLELDRERRIVQTWRTTEFPRSAMDSRLEVLLAPEGAGTRLTLRHSDLPAGQGEKYAAGWRQYYFEPMAEYFGVSKKVIPALRPAKSAGPRGATKKSAGARKMSKKAKPPAATAQRRTKAKKKAGKAKAASKPTKRRATSVRGKAKAAGAKRATSKPKRSSKKARSKR